MKFAIKLNHKDNVATATVIVKRGELVSILSESGEEVDKVYATSDIPLQFHKIALASILKGKEVLKYGEVIGYASEPINRGEWIHIHNIESANLPEKKIK